MISWHFSALTLASIVIFALSIFSPAHAADDSFRPPDSLVLKNGKIVRGLIVKNSRDAVLIQEEFAENTYPKSEIVRIRDEPDNEALFTDVHKKGDLPAWRVIANDLRTHDQIKELQEIPATNIDRGEFKNVPYKSFRVNHDLEMNIFGDPADPAGLEIGIYGSRSSEEKLRKVLRAYLAGFLCSREEIAALYALSFDGGTRQAEDLVLEITPKDAPDAYGAWWISLHNTKKMARARLSDAEYARHVRPVDEVIDRNGNVIAEMKGETQSNLAATIKDLGSSAAGVLRGFSRNDDGDLQLIVEPAAPEAN